MQLAQINIAIYGLCQDVSDTIVYKAWSKMTEKELIHELVLCILGSGVRYEVAVSYAVAITKSKCLSKEYTNDPVLIENKVSEILNGEVYNYWGGKPYRRYRYPNIRAKYISDSYTNIVGEFGSLKLLMDTKCSSTELRKKLVQLCAGIGPKQASHFLKNVGYSDELAIIDSHIIKYIRMCDTNIGNVNQLSKLDTYEHIESLYINAVRKFKYPVAIVDQAMWFVMRELGREAVV